MDDPSEFIGFIDISDSTTLSHVRTLMVEDALEDVPDNYTFTIHDAAELC